MNRIEGEKRKNIELKKIKKIDSNKPISAMGTITQARVSFF